MPDGALREAAIQAGAGVFFALLACVVLSLLVCVLVRDQD